MMLEVFHVYDFPQGHYQTWFVSPPPMDIPWILVPSHLASLCSLRYTFDVIRCDAFYYPLQVFSRL